MREGVIIRRSICSIIDRGVLPIGAVIVHGVPWLDAQLARGHHGGMIRKALLVAVCALALSSCGSSKPKPYAKASDVAQVYSLCKQLRYELIVFERHGVGAGSVKDFKQGLEHSVAQSIPAVGATITKIRALKMAASERPPV
jgi:hypothetical protein